MRDPRTGQEMGWVPPNPMLEANPEDDLLAAPRPVSPGLATGFVGGLQPFAGSYGASPQDQERQALMGLGGVRADLSRSAVPAPTETAFGGTYAGMFGQPATPEQPPAPVPEPIVAQPGMAPRVGDERGYQPEMQRQTSAPMYGPRPQIGAAPLTPNPAETQIAGYRQAPAAPSPQQNYDARRQQRQPAMQRQGQSFQQAPAAPQYGQPRQRPRQGNFAPTTEPAKRSTPQF